MKKLSYLIFAGVLSCLLASCDKNETPANIANEDTTVIADENATEEVGTEIDAIIDESLTLSISATQLRSAITNDSTNYLTSCPIVSLDTVNTTKILTIDFGSECTGKDGKVRSGKIIVKSTSFSKTSVERITTFENYTVEGKKIEGSINKSITRMITAKSRLATITEDLSITFPDNKGTAHRIAKLTRMYEYGLVNIVRDDKITTWGTVEFTGIKGNKITKTVDQLTPLVYKIGCKRIVSGIQIITRSDKQTLTIDYGDGNCDNIATVTNGSKTWTINF